jgi:hypothetical protein
LTLHIGNNGGNTKIHNSRVGRAESGDRKVVGKRNFRESGGIDATAARVRGYVCFSQFLTEIVKTEISLGPSNTKIGSRNGD